MVGVLRYLTSGLATQASAVPPVNNVQPRDTGRRAIHGSASAAVGPVAHAFPTVHHSGPANQKRTIDPVPRLVGGLIGTLLAAGVVTCAWCGLNYRRNRDREDLSLCDKCFNRHRRRQIAGTDNGAGQPPLNLRDINSQQYPSPSSGSRNPGSRANPPNTQRGPQVPASTRSAQSGR